MEGKDLKLSEIKAICKANDGDCSKCELANKDAQILEPILTYSPCGLLTMAFIKPKYWKDKIEEKENG